MSIILYRSKQNSKKLKKLKSRQYALARSILVYLENVVPRHVSETVR
jgi:hypothetical protein